MEEKRGRGGGKRKRRKQWIMSFVRDRKKIYDAVFNFENYGPGCVK